MEENGKFSIDTKSIISTNYGVKNIPTCFGFMCIQNPYTIEAEKFTTPEDMKRVKESFTSKVKDILYSTAACTQCYLFDKCVAISKRA